MEEIKTKNNVIIKQDRFPTKYRKHIEYEFDFINNPVLREQNILDLIKPEDIKDANVKIKIEGTETDQALVDIEKIREKVEKYAKVLKPISPSFTKNKNKKDMNEVKKVINDPKKAIDEFLKSRKNLNKEDKDKIKEIAYNIIDRQ